MRIIWILSFAVNAAIIVAECTNLNGWFTERYDIIVAGNGFAMGISLMLALDNKQ